MTAYSLLTITNFLLDGLGNYITNKRFPFPILPWSMEIVILKKSQA